MPKNIAGKRPGRPHIPESERHKSLTVTLPPVIILSLETLAAARGWNKSRTLLVLLRSVSDKDWVNLLGGKAAALLTMRTIRSARAKEAYHATLNRAPVSPEPPVDPDPDPDNY